MPMLPVISQAGADRVTSVRGRLKRLNAVCGFGTVGSVVLPHHQYSCFMGEFRQ